jgi:predicted membrane channel-forming protein YqfA (hemolysin III family)
MFMAAVPPPPDIWDRIAQVFRFLSVQEVKTPLSFTFKAAFYLVVVWIVVVVWGPGDEDFKKWFVEFSALIVGCLCVGVWIFAWFNPVNLVYGESGHRAQRKMELYGTERKLYTESELGRVPQTENQGQLPPPEER